MSELRMSWPLDHKDFENRHRQKQLDTLVNVAALGFGFVVFAVLIWQFIAGNPTEWLTKEFWLEPNLGAVALWLVILTMCFVVYRGVRLSLQRIPLPRPARGESKNQPLDIVKSFAPEIETLLATAHDLAKQTSSHTVHTAHLFIASFTTKPVANLMWRLGMDLQKLRPDLIKIIQKEEGERVADPEFSVPAREVIQNAYELAEQTKRPYVTGLEIMLAAVQKDPDLQDALRDAGVDAKQLANAAAWIRANDDLRNWRTKFLKAAANRPGGAMNRAMTSIATPLLDRFCDDLTSAAQNGALPPLVGREQEMENVLRIMESGRQSVVLVGPNGVGREALINGLAIKMVLEEVPQILRDKRLLELSIPKLVAGASSIRGADPEQMLLAALAEAGNSGNIILAIPNLNLMSGSGSSGSVDLLATFAAELEKGYFVCIGTATPDEYSKSIERTPLGTQMQRVNIQEMSADDAIRVLETKVGQFEYEFDVAFSYAALESAVKLTDRYDHERLLPGKAIEVAREAALAVSKSRGAQSKAKDAKDITVIVGAEDVAALVSQKTNIKVTEVSSDESQKLLNLEAEIGKRVIGQEEAVKAVSAALRRARTELRTGARPIGSFLFLGPTGVGKTELSKAVAQTYFGSEKEMIRLDMSEYQDAGSVNRLLGVPGSGQGGVLTEAVRKHPYALLLCDELEKAHKDILNLFLQVMDDGRLTDATGRTVDFTNTIVIMTSNAGTQFIQDSLAKSAPLGDIKKQLLETELKTIYRPEFLNRFDEVVVFRPLTLKEATKIAELMILGFANTLEEKGINFHASEQAIANLATKGYDPLFGARPMRRAIQDTLENEIANLMLKNELKRGDTAILTEQGTVNVEQKA